MQKLLLPFYSRLDFWIYFISAYYLSADFDGLHKRAYYWLFLILQIFGPPNKGRLKDEKNG